MGPLSYPMRNAVLAIHEHGGELLAVDIHHRTLPVLLRAGWVERAESGGWVRLTPAGRDLVGVLGR